MPVKPGVPSFADLTIPCAWRAARERHATKRFVRCDDQDLTYEQFHGRMLQAMGTLQDLGIEAGDRVALLMGNTIEHLVSWFAIAHIGAIAVSINPRLTDYERRGVVRAVKPSLLLGDSDAAPLGLAMGIASVDTNQFADHSPGAVIEVVNPESVASFIMTSGSTGQPKAVMQTHRTYVLTGQAFPGWIGLTPNDHLGVVLPLSHINAQAYSVMGALAVGASLELLPRFSASSFWNSTRERGVTQFNAVGAIVQILAAMPELPEDASNPVRLCYTAYALPEREHRAFETRFGLQLTVGYGLSETTFGTVWPLSGAPPYGTIGLLRQHPVFDRINEAMVVDERGVAVLPNKVGELRLRNPAVMAGYFEDPQATQAAIQDGWLCTGDLVTCDDEGVFRFVGRKKDVIRRRGENVVAAEIEAVLGEHPGVHEVAVIGVPSELTEEDIRAFVVLQPESAVTELELLTWCRTRLAPYKVPDEMVFRTMLPHTATHRIAKLLLR